MQIDKRVIDSIIYYTEAIENYEKNYCSYFRDVITVYYSRKIGLFKKKIIATEQFRFHRPNSTIVNHGIQSDGTIKFKEFLNGLVERKKMPLRLEELEKVYVGRTDDFALGVTHAIEKMKKDLE